MAFSPGVGGTAAAPAAAASSPFTREAFALSEARGSASGAAARPMPGSAMLSPPSARAASLLHLELDDVGDAFQFTLGGGGVAATGSPLSILPSQQQKRGGAGEAGGTAPPAPPTPTQGPLRPPSAALLPLQPPSRHRGPRVAPPFAAGMASGSFHPTEGEFDSVLLSTSARINGWLTGTLNAFAPALPLDVGGCDDVVGKRLNMALPLPGALLRTTLLTRAEARALLRASLGSEAISLYNSGGSSSQRRAAREAAPFVLRALSSPSDGANRSRSALMLRRAESKHLRQQSSVVLRGNEGTEAELSPPLAPPRLLLLGGGSGSSSSEDGGSSGGGGGGSADEGSGGEGGGSGGGSDDDDAALWRARSRSRRRAAAAPRPVALPPRPRPAASMGALFCSVGVTPLGLFAPLRSHGACSAALRRLFFLLSRRLLLRAAPPPPPGDKWRFAFAFFLHFALLILEVTLNLLFIASLWCLEPRNNGEVLVAAQCSYTLLLFYLLLPPGAALLPPLLGLVAITTQSAPLLREYGAWHATSVLPVLALLGLAESYAGQLGGVALGLPLTLLGIKVIQAQLLTVLLAEVEAARPVRGWRGLLQVRTGVAERVRRQGGGALGGGGEGGGRGARSGSSAGAGSKAAHAGGAFHVGGGLGKGGRGAK